VGWGSGKLCVIGSHRLGYTSLGRTRRHKPTVVGYQHLIAGLHALAVDTVPRGQESAGTSESPLSPCKPVQTIVTELRPRLRFDRTATLIESGHPAVLAVRLHWVVFCRSTSRLGRAGIGHSA
jgi:hypothetical protein